LPTLADAEAEWLLVKVKEASFGHFLTSAATNLEWQI
jgi:hypothetical protein